MPYVIYYTSRTLIHSQKNYSTTEKELLAMVFALDKFRPYLLCSKVIVFTDYATLKHLLAKNNTKRRLIKWILFPQEFDIEIKDMKGSEIQLQTSCLESLLSILMTQLDFLTTFLMSNYLLCHMHLSLGLLPSHQEDSSSMVQTRES